jgi:hypothetical protein
MGLVYVNRFRPGKTNFVDVDTGERVEKGGCV